MEMKPFSKNFTYRSVTVPSTNIGPIFPWLGISHHTVTCRGWRDFSITKCRFPVSQMHQFCLLTNPSQHMHIIISIMLCDQPRKLNFIMQIIQKLCQFNFTHFNNCHLVWIIYFIVYKQWMINLLTVLPLPLLPLRALLVVNAIFVHVPYMLESFLPVCYFIFLHTALISISFSNVLYAFHHHF